MSSPASTRPSPTISSPLSTCQLILKMGILTFISIVLGVSMLASNGDGLVFHRRDTTTWRRRKSHFPTADSTTAAHHQQAPSIITTIRTHFPECAVYFKHPLQHQINITRDAHYVESTYEPRYDHVSCFAMKARYNCARRAQSDDNAKFSLSTATDFKLVLRSKTVSSSEEEENLTASNSGTYCDIRAVIDHMGGPVGVAKALNAQQNTSRSDRIPKKTRMLIVGNSFLRQIFEALACGWRTDLTNNAFQVGGPIINQASKKWVIRNMTEDRVGKMTRIDTAKDGCHSMQKARDDLSKYYRPSVPIPETILGCDDNAAFLEFGGILQIRFVFWPFVKNQAVFSYLMKATRIDNHPDYIFWNFNALNFLPKSIRSPNMRSLDSLLPQLKKIQKRDLHRWFGAINPWITHPPDAHPCMPGVPDDEANLLLFLLLSNAIIA